MAPIGVTLGYGAGSEVDAILVALLPYIDGTVQVLRRRAAGLKDGLRVIVLSGAISVDCLAD
jgi:hypothetical protein